MFSLYKYRIITALALLPLITLASVRLANAQGDISGGALTSRKDLSGGAGSGGGSRPAGGGGGVVRQPRQRTNTVTVQNARRNTGSGGGGGTVTTPTLGSLSVVAEPGATVYLDPPGQGQSLKGEVGSDRIFIFDKLRPGKYTVSAELNGEEYASDKPVTIVRNTPTSLSLEAPTYSATLTTNIRTGYVLYASAVIKGNEYVPTGRTFKEDINGGQAMLKELKPGRYIADIIPGDPGYDKEQISFKVSDNMTIPVTLENVESKSTFTDTSFSNWEAPSGWRASSGVLNVSGAGVGLPRDKDFRFYKDFQLSSDVKMVNGVAASFVLRAKDARNYYLVQLTGTSGDEPYVLRGFIIRDGVATQMGGKASIVGFSSTLKTDQFFKVKMVMAGNKVRVYVTDSMTGAEETLGILTDPNNVFPIGAPGIAVRDREQNVFGNFIVCTPTCR